MKEHLPQANSMQRAFFPDFLWYVSLRNRFLPASINNFFLFFLFHLPSLAFSVVKRVSSALDLQRAFLAAVLRGFFGVDKPWSLRFLVVESFVKACQKPRPLRYQPTFVCLL